MSNIIKTISVNPAGNMNTEIQPKEVIPVRINGRTITYIGHGRVVKVSEKYAESVAQIAAARGIICTIQVTGNNVPDEVPQEHVSASNQTPSGAEQVSRSESADENLSRAQAEVEAATAKANALQAELDALKSGDAEESSSGPASEGNTPPANNPPSFDFEKMEWPKGFTSKEKLLAYAEHLGLEANDTMKNREITEVIDGHLNPDFSAMKFPEDFNDAQLVVYATQLGIEEADGMSEEQLVSGIQEKLDEAEKQS